MTKEEIYAEYKTLRDKVEKLTSYWVSVPPHDLSNFEKYRHLQRENIELELKFKIEAEKLGLKDEAEQWEWHYFCTNRGIDSTGLKDIDNKIHENNIIMEKLKEPFREVCNEFYDFWLNLDDKFPRINGHIDNECVEFNRSVFFQWNLLNTLYKTNC